MYKMWNNGAQNMPESKWFLLVYCRQEHNKCAIYLHHKTISYINIYEVGRRYRDRMVLGFTTTYAKKSVPITSNVGSSNPTHGEVYSIQHYVIKFVSDLRQVGDFFRVLLFPPPIKLTATKKRQKKQQQKQKQKQKTKQKNKKKQTNKKREFCFNRIEMMIDWNSELD